MIKKFIIFYFVINILNICLAENIYKIILTVNNYPITKIDLDNEIKILSILNKKKISNEEKNIAINNLIDETIKYQEIEKENLTTKENLIREYFLTLIKNLNINEDEINPKFVSLIKKKINIDKLWNDLIVKKYSWKLNINMQEIEKKLNKKENNYSDKEKEKIIMEEKNKKLAVFSKYHLNMIKKQSLIKFLK